MELWKNLQGRGAHLQNNNDTISTTVVPTFIWLFRFFGEFVFGIWPSHKSV